MERIRGGGAWVSEVLSQPLHSTDGLGHGMRCVWAAGMLPDAWPRIMRTAVSGDVAVRVCVNWKVVNDRHTSRLFSHHSGSQQA